MTPLYDVLSIWPYAGTGRGQLYRGNIKQAMALRSKNAHYKISEIRARHWHALAHKYGGESTWDAMLAMTANVEDALNHVEKILPNGFSQKIWNPIATNMHQQAREFLAQAPTERNLPLRRSPSPRM